MGIAIAESSARLRIIKKAVVFQTCWKANKNCNVEKIAGLVLPFLSDSFIQQV